MKKLKRFAAVLLTGVMALSILTGCFAGASSEYGEWWSEEILTLMNSERTDELKNDTKLQRKLERALNKINGKTSELNGDDAFKLEMTQDATGHTEIELEMVLTLDLNNYESLMDQNDQIDVNKLKDIAAKKAGIVQRAENINLSTEQEMMRVVTRLISPIAPYMDSFAVSYRVVDENIMYLAIGFTAQATTDMIV